MSRRIKPLFLLTLTLAASIGAPASRLARAQPPDAGAPLEVIRGSLESIRERPARQRWKVDVALWDLVGDHVTHVDRTAILAIAPRLHDITLKAAQMVGGQEHRRWSASVELWRTLDSHPSPLTRNDLKALRAIFEAMSTTVGDNALPGDRERRAANCALWRAALESLSK